MRIPIPYPKGGLNRGSAFSEQPPNTTQRATNMRNTDLPTGRDRGCSREGLVAYGSFSFGSNVKRMESVVIDDRQQSYIYKSSPTAAYATATPSASASSRVIVDSIGDAYFFDGDTAFVKVNSYAQVLWKQVVETLDSTHKLLGFAVDDELSVYVSVGYATGGVPDATSQGKAIVAKYVLNDSADGYVLAWTYKPIRFVPDLVWNAGTLYTIEVDYIPASTGRNTYITSYPDPSRLNNLNVLTKDLDILIPHASIWTVGGQDRNLIGHALTLRTNGPIEFVVCGTDGGANGGTQARFLCKVNTLGAVVWKFTDATGDASYGGAALGTGAIGYGVKVDSTGNVISTGYVSPHTGQGLWLRRIIDNGSTASLTGTGTWTSADSLGLTYEYLHPAIDPFDNVLAPYHVGTLGSPGGHAVRVFAGSLNTASTLGTEIISSSVADVDDTAGPINVARACAVLPAGQPYTPKYLTDDIKVSQYVFVAVGVTTGATHGMQKRLLITTTVTAGSPRDFINIAAVLPDIKTFTVAGVTTPTGGASALQSNANYISTAVDRGLCFVADGVNYFVVDPRPTVANPNGTVVPWISKTSGVIPERGRLLCTWRTRVLIGRTTDEPHNVYLGAADNPYDWDYNPFDTTLKQALNTNLTGVGTIPDLPNSFCPWSNDLMIVFCDHSIWQLTGSPAKGGDIDRISSITGGSFGKPWCVDPEGRIYFHGDRGGIYMMQPGSQPRRISTDSIDQDLLDIDLGSYYVEMAWDDLLQAIHVFQFPYGSGGTIVKHWTFERASGAVSVVGTPLPLSGAWMPQQFGTTQSTAVQPTALLVLDGDQPTDRVVLLAGEDGKLGSLSPTATTDRGATIYSEVLIGPLVLNPGKRARVTSLEIALASELSGCSYEVFVSDVPDITGDPVSGGELAPGHNFVSASGCGAFLWLRLYSGTSGRRFAYESGAANVYSAGRLSVSA